MRTNKDLKARVAELEAEKAVLEKKLLDKTDEARRLYSMGVEVNRYVCQILDTVPGTLVKDTP